MTRDIGANFWLEAAGVKYGSLQRADGDQMQYLPPLCKQHMSKQHKLLFPQLLEPLIFAVPCHGWSQQCCVWCFLPVCPIMFNFPFWRQIWPSIFSVVLCRTLDPSLKVLKIFTSCIRVTPAAFVQIT